VLPGQLAFQPFYGEHPPLLPPRQGPAHWNEPIRLAPAVAREVINYVQWQLSQRGQG
jgi:hypothetical protein